MYKVFTYPHTGKQSDDKGDGNFHSNQTSTSLSPSTKKVLTIKGKKKSSTEDPKWELGDWNYVHDSKSTLMAGKKAVQNWIRSNPRLVALLTTLPYCWTGSYNLFSVGRQEPRIEDK